MLFVCRRDVHIIDLHSVASAAVDSSTSANASPQSSSSTTATLNSVVPVVEIDIHPRHRRLAESGRSATAGASAQQQQRRHVILILKLRRGAAVWKIRTNGLRGTLDIVVSFHVYLRRKFGLV
jgi:hypothetical protein